MCMLDHVLTGRADVPPSADLCLPAPRSRSQLDLIEAETAAPGIRREDEALDASQRQAHSVTSENMPNTAGVVRRIARLFHNAGAV